MAFIVITVVSLVFAIIGMIIVLVKNRPQLVDYNEIDN